ncbi:MAG: CPBP family intramembrane glutamic endopeptidase [Elusimicrobiota bacterium]|jgi:membrane protease YdiL (CAAX protease family)
MNERTVERLRKLAASVLAAALLVTAPGLETARAAGAVVAALGVQSTPAGVPQVGAVSATLSPLLRTDVGLRLEGLEGGKALVLPSAPLVRAGILPAVQGFVPAAKYDGAGTSASAQRPAPEAIVAAQTKLQSPAAVVAAPSASEGRTLVERFTGWFTGAQKGGALETSRAPSTLGALFENGRRANALDESPVPAADEASLSSNGLEASAQEGKGRVSEVPAPEAAKSAAPRSTLSRSVKVGLLMAVIGLVSAFIIPAVAAAFGYQVHSNYRSPASIPLHSLFDVAKVATAASVMAPVTEEVIFRGGLMGGLSWLAAKYTKSTFARVYLPAIVSSVIFVAVHETADPVLFAARLVQSLLFAAVYQKEGIIASMVMHFGNNIIPTIGIVSTWVLGNGSVALLAFVLEAAYAWGAFNDLKAERAQRADGRIVPYRLTPVRALVLAGVAVFGLLVCSLTLKTTLIWGAAALLLLGYALVQGRREGWPWKSPDLGALRASRRGVSEESKSAPAQAVAPASENADAPRAPRRELSRSIKYGFVMAVLSFALSMLLQAAAAKLGLPVPPPTPAGVPAALTALPAAIAAVTVMAPIAEEALFRGGLLRGLGKVFGRIPGTFWSFWLPAVLSSAAFVLFHMNASPLIALMRFASSMFLSWTAHHEGIAAAMAQHSLSNAIEILLPASAMFGPIGGFTAIALMGSLFMKTRQELRTDEPARSAGDIQPYPLTWKSAALLAAVLGAGLFIAPTPLLALIWAAGAAALTGWAGWDYYRTHRSRA